MSVQAQAELGDKIKRYLDVQNASALRRLLARHNYADIADVMETQLSEEQALTCFQYMNMGQAAEVVTSLNEDLQQACLNSLTAVMGSKILRIMAADDAVDILQEMDRSESQKYLDEMPYDSDTRTIHNLLLEEPDTAAGLMATDFIKVSVEATVAEAMDEVRTAEEKDFIYYTYLVDGDDHLVAIVSLKKLILHDGSVPLSRIAEYDVKMLLDSYDQELAANIFRKYDNLLAMPVVDSVGKLRGIVTIDDIVDVIEEETSEEMYRAAGIELEEIDEKHLISGPFTDAVKARVPWLFITVVGQLMASLIISSYSKTVATAVVAISFMPLLTGLSGNMGAQTNTITIRGLSQNLIHADNITEKIWRELKVALLTGLVLGSFVAITSLIMYQDSLLSILLFSWIAISLCFTAFLGMFLPYVIEKILKMDPASIGGPVITTLSDILTFSVYLYVLTLFLEHFAK